MIVHITTQNKWNEAQTNGLYTHPSLLEEGFIHCTKPSQTEEIGNAYYKGIKDVILLVIDPLKLTSPLKYEYSTKFQDDYPHIYGSINIDSVIQVLKFPCSTNGIYVLPTELYKYIED